MPTKIEPLLTADDVARLLGISRAAVYNLCCIDAIPGALLIGRLRRFNPAIVRPWIASRTLRGRHPFEKGAAAIMAQRKRHVAQLKKARP